MRTRDRAGFAKLKLRKQPKFCSEGGVRDSNSDSDSDSVGDSPPPPQGGSNHLVWYRNELRCSAASKTLNNVVMTMRL